MTDRPDFPHSYDGLSQLVRHLRAPGGCPWDREQTPSSLRPLLLEECYELIEAIDENDNDALLEELGTRPKTTYLGVVELPKIVEGEP